VGPSYHLNDELERRRGGFPFDLYVWHAKAWVSRDAHAAGTLDGERALPPRWTVQWDRFLGAPPRAQRAQRIDTCLAQPLRYLPISVSHPSHREIAFRTLVRGWHLGLPSGQSVAQQLNLVPLPPQHPHGDPLFVYVLREAELAAQSGGQLGPVGARIVAEVCVRLLEADPESLLHRPRWSPTVTNGGHFTLREFLEYARMPISQADWVRVVGPERVG
jgi:hypothetical protein